MSAPSSSASPSPSITARAPLAPFLAALAAQSVLLLAPLVPFAFFVRPLPVLVLAAHVARRAPLQRAWPVALGLAFGGAGDVAMTLRKSMGEAALLAGIGLFFAGHLGYGLAFFRERAPRPGRALWALVFVAAALGAAGLLLPRLGSLAVPVGAYAVVLTAMTALAALRGAASPMVLRGAAMFFVSDVIIGVRLATPAVPTALLALVLPTYYVGQYWIAVGFARDAGEQERAGFDVTEAPPRPTGSA